MGEEVVFYRFPCFTEKTALETCAKPTFKKASGKKGDLRITFIYRLWILVKCVPGPGLPRKKSQTRDLV